VKLVKGKDKLLLEIFSMEKLNNLLFVA